MPKYRNLGVILKGQSNLAGAALSDNGGVAALLTNPYNGKTDPYFPNSNGGGSCVPWLEYLLMKRGIRPLILNCAVGGSAVSHWTGLVGATVTGSQSDPLFFHNMGNSGLSTNTGTTCVEGNAQFDPFGLQADTRAKKAMFPQITEWVSIWLNAESDGGTPAAQYQAGLNSMIAYDFASGVNAQFIGLSSSGNNSQANMGVLQGAVRATVAQNQALGKKVFLGADLYAKWGMNPPLYTERFAVLTKVHGGDVYQTVQAELLAESLRLAGY